MPFNLANFVPQAGKRSIAYPPQFPLLKLVDKNVAKKNYLSKSKIKSTLPGKLEKKLFL